MKDKNTIEASLFTAFPRFRDALPAILDILTSKGGTYSPQFVEFDTAGKLQRMQLLPERTAQLAKLWKDMPFSSMLAFQKRRPVWVRMHVGNTLNNFNVVGMSIEQDYFSEKGRPEELLNALKELYNVVHPMYGRVSSNETVRWVESPLGKMSLGTALRRALPDIYWANFFGPEYVEMFGSDRVNSAPIHSVESLSDGGALLVLSPSPLDFLKDPGEFERLRLNLKRHLGEEAFDKGWPETQGKVPRFRYDEQWKAEFARWKAEYLRLSPDFKESGYLSNLPHSEWKDWIENNSSIATAFVSEMKAKGLALNFSEQSLYELDDYIDKSGWMKKGASIELVKKLGAYVAQMIIAGNGGKWFFDDREELPSLVIGEVRVTPLARILKVFEEGEKLGPWYTTVVKIIPRLQRGKPANS